LFGCPAAPERFGRSAAQLRIRPAGSPKLVIKDAINYLAPEANPQDRLSIFMV
jgi:hypothetical protein